MRRFLITVVLTLALAATGGAKHSVNGLPFATTDKLDAPINHFIDVQGIPAFLVADILLGTSSQAGIVQVFPNCTNQGEVHLRVEQGRTIRQGLDAFVHADPRYQWTLNDGVVIVTPKAGTPLLLATKLHSFTWSGTDKSAPSVPLIELFQLPEIRARVAKLGLSPAIMQGPGTTTVEINPVPGTPLPIKVSLKNLSLMDAFSEIIRVYGRGMWVYTEDRCSQNGAKRFSIDSRP